MKMNMGVKKALENSDNMLGERERENERESKRFYIFTTTSTQLNVIYVAFLKFSFFKWLRSELLYFIFFNTYISFFLQEYSKWYTYLMQIISFPFKLNVCTPYGIYCILSFSKYFLHIMSFSKKKLHNMYSWLM